MLGVSSGSLLHQQKKITANAHTDMNEDKDPSSRKPDKCGRRYGGYPVCKSTIAFDEVVNFGTREPSGGEATGINL
jgi:hypothetical protein